MSESPLFNKEPQEDETLVASAKEGDRQAFEVLVKRHQKKILNVCYRTVGYSDEARELAADVFAEAFCSLKQFRSQAKFGSWLYRIALNLCFQHLHKKAKERRLIVEPDEKVSETPLSESIAGRQRLASEALAWEETLGDIRLTLSKISKGHAEILVLCDIEEFSYSEVAQLLGCPEGTVMSRLSRAREAFRKVWNELATD